MYVIVNTKERTAEIFTTATGAANYLNINRNTIATWRQSNTFHKYNNFEIYFESAINRIKKR